MKSLINIWDKDKNFWEVNPVFKSLKFFSDLYKKDKEKKKAKSKISLDLWFVAHMLDFGSPLGDLESDPDSEHGKEQLTSSNIFGDKTYWDKNVNRLEEYFKMYEMFCLTQAQRSMRAWYEKLQQRDQVLKDTEYIVGVTDANGKLANSNVAILDTMLVNSGKVWDQYFKIKEQIEAEENSGTSKGGSEESASDTGDI